MLVVLLIFLLFLGLCIIYLMPALMGYSIFARYRGDRLVTCPETKNPVVVELDAHHAAVTGLTGKPETRIAGCTRWPEREECDQACLPQAVNDAVILEARPSEFRESVRGLNHAAVFISAAVFWMVGAFWYSEQLFRPAWMRLVGLSDSAERRRFDADSSAFTLAFVGALVLAYVLDWVIVRTGRPSILRGAVEGLALGVAATLTPLFAVMAFEARPTELFWIHGGFMLLGCLMIGAIEGGWAQQASKQGLARRPA